MKVSTPVNSPVTMMLDCRCSAKSTMDPKIATMAPSYRRARNRAPRPPGSACVGYGPDCGSKPPAVIRSIYWRSSAPVALVHLGLGRVGKFRAALAGQAGKFGSTVPGHLGQFGAAFAGRLGQLGAVFTRQLGDFGPAFAGHVGELGAAFECQMRDLAASFGTDLQSVAQLLGQDAVGE